MERTIADEAEAEARNDMVETLMVDLMTWAMKRDPDFRTEQEASLTEMKKQAEKKMAENPTPQAAAELKIAKTFLGVFGMKGWE